ncbi:hypothetical protein BDD12DRAFT_982801 [Trichophaea hybrida]|nr:hypothetical protein BDD12DRAFT_982801 [Trichophaea hybrida]
MLPSHNDMYEASSPPLHLPRLLFSPYLSRDRFRRVFLRRAVLCRLSYTIQHLCDLAPSAVGKANVIRQVLAHLYPLDEGCSGGTLPLTEILLRARREALNPQVVFPRIDDFTQALLECFFVPILAEGGKTSAPPSRGSPLFLTSRSRIPSEHAQPGSDHLPDLRRMCLARDSYRCVATGWMDMRSFQSQQIAARNAGELASFEDFPHALNRGELPGDGLSESNTFVWQVLEMFDTGSATTARRRSHRQSAQRHHPAIRHTPNVRPVVVLVQRSSGPSPQPQTLFAANLPENEPHTYTIATACRIPLAHLAAHLSPDKRISFTDYSSEGVDLPDPRLLGLHAVCAKILDMSGAAEYVERLFHESEEVAMEGTLASDYHIPVVGVLQAQHSLRTCMSLALVPTLQTFTAVVVSATAAAGINVITTIRILSLGADMMGEFEVHMGQKVSVECRDSSSYNPDHLCAHEVALGDGTT